MTTSAGVAPGGAADDVGGRRLAVIVSRFPKLTETFVLNEILEMHKLGIAVELYPLLRHKEGVLQPGVEPVASDAHYRSYLSAQLWQDNLYYLFRCPGRLLRVFAGVVRQSWPSPRYLAGAVAFFPKAVSFARHATAVNVEHVHAQFANHAAVVGMVISELTGIPFSFTARGSDIHVDRTMLAAKVAAAKLAVTVSAYNRAVMVEACGRESAAKIHVVYGGIDTSLFAPHDTPERAGDPQIVCVARFEEVKGHAQLLEACGILRTRGVSFTCNLVGDGHLRRALERQVEELSLQRQVIFHGNLPHHEVIAALRSADVFVLATVRAASGKREGIPNVLKEAMACCVPVVSTRISGIPELIEDGVTGILVAPGNPEALAEALIRLTRDGAARERMGRAGRARVQRDFEIRASTLRRARLFFADQSDSALDGLPETSIGKSVQHSTTVGFGDSDGRLRERES